jgi:hypothetical protein
MTASGVGPTGVPSRALPVALKEGGAIRYDPAVAAARGRDDAVCRSSNGRGRCPHCVLVFAKDGSGHGSSLGQR